MNNNELYLASSVCAKCANTIAQYIDK